MSRSLNCPNGHSVPIDGENRQTELLCPECGAAVASNGESDAGRPRGLWNVMTGKPADSSNPPPEQSEAPTERDSPQDAPTQDPETPDEVPAPRGLWSVISRERPDAVTPDASAHVPAEAAEVSETVPGQTSDEASEGADDGPLDFSADDEQREVATLEQLAAQQEAEESERDRNRPVDKPPAVAAPSRGAKQSLLLGIVGVLSSALALLPEFWLRLIGTGFGFLALMIGLLAFTEIRRSRGRQGGTNVAGAGIVLGALAMLLGPFLFTPLGVQYRERSGRLRTHNNLAAVGAAVNRHHDDHNEYPRLSLREEQTELHNWATQLLPYLGDEEAALAETIDLKQPYDADVNRQQMKRNIPAFLASGSSDERTRDGFAVTHFVPLAGEMDVPDVGRVSVGVFDRVRVTRGDVTDGLEHTLVVGEVAAEFPAWGQPGHSRQIGSGLNKARDGFGNADRTGAMFLRADGSVRFFSNRVDVQVLRKLSTRNGRESVEMPDF